MQLAKSLETYVENSGWDKRSGRMYPDHEPVMRSVREVENLIKDGFHVRVVLDNETSLVLDSMALFNNILLPKFPDYTAWKNNLKLEEERKALREAKLANNTNTLNKPEETKPEPKVETKEEEKSDNHSDNTEDKEESSIPKKKK